MVLRRLARRLLREPPAPESTRIARLRQAGLRIGRNCSIYSLDYDRNLPELISIGDDCTLAHGVTILTHDVAPSLWLGQTKVAPTTIHDRVFIGQRAILLAGVTVGPDAIVGAGAVVSQDVPPRTVVAGNPARVVSTLDDYLARQKATQRYWWYQQDLPGMEEPDRPAKRERARTVLKALAAQVLREGRPPAR